VSDCAEARLSLAGVGARRVFAQILPPWGPCRIYIDGVRYRRMRPHFRFE